MSQTETVTLNLDGTFAAGADKAAGAGKRLIDTVDGLSNALDEGKKSAEGHGKGVLTIRDPAAIANRALTELTAGVKGFTSALATGDARGSIEGASTALAGLAQTLDFVVPGLGQLAGAVIKVGGAFAGMTAGIIQAGVELATETRATNTSLEATFEALGKGPEAGKRTVEMLDDVRDLLPQTREQIAAWTREIEKMGVTDLGQVRQELLATASAQGILGEEGPAAYERISRKVHDAIEGHHALKIASKELTRTIGTNLAGAAAERMGLTLEQLEVKLKAGTVDAAKFGNALEGALVEKGARGLDAMWMRTGTITAKLKDSFGQLFADVDTGPLTDAMRDLLALFDQTQPSGQAMKATITDAFNGIIKAIGHAITEGEVWFLQTEVYGLSMELALKPYMGALKVIASMLADITGLTGAIDVAKLAGGALSTVPAPGAPPRTAEQLKADVMAKALDPVGAMISGVGDNIALGLVNSLLGHTTDVAAAGKQLGEAGVKGVQDGAGVHSPSLPAMRIGGHISEGLGLGMVNASALPERAGREIGGYALGGVGRALTGAPANANGGAAGVTIGTLHLQVVAPHGVTDATAISASGLAAAVERLQLASGR